jgi:hypothetical protein
MRRFSTLLLDLGCLYGFTFLARVQSAIELSGLGGTYIIGAQGTFSAKNRLEQSSGQLIGSSRD